MPISPEKYARVKEIFLAACERPDAERRAFVEQEAAGDAELRAEVESLLDEQRRENPAIPHEPVPPLGSMSAILSRANIHVTDADSRRDPDETLRRDPTAYLDDSHSTPSGSDSGFVDAGRFMAGTVVGGRYRIIELLGRGGMGEVYRADDLALNASIAMKFLPPLFGADQRWLDRLKNEVRLARQVTHPNVCRVFDLGEFQGEQFITMEYVDGENLASLLRRIGRVPAAKGLQIVRQLCAGLAAAHDRGVLHRDLKPANVMIDGRGAVRITDFGLAAPADQMRTDGIRAGTPAYMSPEQLAGRPITVRSDIYSLGLLLYEMFTGRRAFKGESLRDYQKLHTSEEPVPPHEIVDDIDPIVERVILKCLEKDPRNRPATGIAVSASLPGGNPLREILAAGETPSPEVVAAAGEATLGLRPRWAAFWLVAGLLSLLAVILLSPRAYLVQQAIDHKPPVVLADRAKTLMKRFGYTRPPKDAASGFAVNSAYYLHIEDTHRKFGADADRWKLLVRPRPGLIYYWYRQSPELLVPWQPDQPVAEDDPPAARPGMVKVALDPDGDLIGFEAEPSRMLGVPPPASPDTPASTAGHAATVDWLPLLRAARLDPATLTAVTPTEAPPVFADTRMAWDGRLPDAPDEPVHIEAAAYRGRPVFFAITGQWKEERFSAERAQLLSAGLINVVVQTLVAVFLLCAGSVLAWRNYRSGRGDRQGATRLALLFLALGIIAWTLLAHHLPDLFSEFTLFRRAMGSVLYPVSLVWIFYLALEPYVRRVWPETIISWSRMLAGKWIDPLVGRDVLVGVAVGIFIALLQSVDMVLPRRLGFPAPMPSINAISRVLTSVSNFSTFFSAALTSVYVGLLLLLLLVLLRMALRRKVLAAVFFVGILVGATARWYPLDFTSIIVQTIMGCLLLTLTIRNGLVATVFCLLARNYLGDFPITANLHAWYATSAFLPVAAIILMLLIAFYAARGGRPLIAVRLLNR